MQNITRRSLLIASAGGIALLTMGKSSSVRAHDSAVLSSTDRAFSTVGTTLEETAAPTTDLGYTRLAAGPGYPLVVRDDLCSARLSRDTTRAALASIVQFTDLHLIDAQSPMRFEFMTMTNGSAFRAHEALGTHAAAQLVHRVNEVKRGPFSDRPFDCVVSTGDNSDNNEAIEMDWFLTVMNGGSIVANTGSTSEWEGVQTTGKELYYNPDLSVNDRFKQAGFPWLPGYFARATATHLSEGLKTPWFSVFGNHDDSIGGTVPADWLPLEDLYTGGTKFTGFTSDVANNTLAAAFEGQKPGLGADAEASARWQVTPDERRVRFSQADFVAAHLADSAVGPGPAGHGFDSSGLTYYSFDIAPGVVGISLDSTNPAGFTHGSLGDAQFRWLEDTLRVNTSSYYDETGAIVSRFVEDRYFVIFSHHTSGSMDNPLPDPRNPAEARHLGPDVVALLKRYPTVIAWVNGHTHTNSIRPHFGDSARQSFWEINTASHIEFPQQARIIDVCTNHDGSLSLFTTLIESAAPYQADYDDGSQGALASLYREFSINDLGYTGSHIGAPNDHNTELMLTDPLA